MTKPVAAIILAAGLSRRMGTPKMLLPWGQTTVLSSVIETFAQAGVEELVIVSGGARQAIESEARKWRGTVALDCVYNPDFETGEMLSSIQCGLAALGKDLQAVLIGLGDQPQLSLASILAVTGAYEKTSGRLIVPSYNLHRGHPWLVGRQYWGELLDLQPPLTTRDFLTRHSAEINYVSADPTVLKDLDTPQDYERDRP